MKNLIYTILLLSVVVWIACSKKNEATQTEIKTGNNNVIRENALPDGFPSDIPIYKDAKNMGSVKTSGGSTVTFEINDKAKAVGDFYKQELVKNGYEADPNNDKMSNDNQGVISFKKGGKTVDLTYKYNDAKGKTMLTILIR